MNDNYGDYLLYNVLSSFLSKYEANYEIYSSDVSRAYDEFEKIERKQKLSAIIQSDLTILDGGGYFGEPDSRKLYWSMRFLWKHGLPLLLLPILKKRYAIIGIETGPLTYYIPRVVTKYIMNNAEVLSVRNKESKKFLEALNVKNEIIVIPDLVLSYELQQLNKETEYAEKVLEKFSNNRKNILVHLTTKNTDDNFGISAIVNYLTKLPNQYNYFVVCDQKRDSQEERAKAIVEKLTKECSVFVPYESPWKLNSLIAEVDAVITDKLHVGIVGIRNKKRVISVYSNGKSKRFYKEIGLNNNSIKLSRLDEEAFGDVFNKVIETEKFESINSKLLTHSKENLRLIEGFIEGKK